MYTTGPSLNNQPLSLHPGLSQPLHPALASTPSLSFNTQAQPPHPASVSTFKPSPYIHSSPSLYIWPHPLHPASASTPSLSFYTQTKPLRVYIQPRLRHSVFAPAFNLNLYIHSTVHPALASRQATHCPIVHDASKCFFFISILVTVLGFYILKSNHLHFGTFTYTLMS